MRFQSGNTELLECRHFSILEYDWGTENLQDALYDPENPLKFDPELARAVEEEVNLQRHPNFSD